MAARSGCVCVVLLAGVAGCVSPATPYNTRGVALFNTGQYEAARAEFLEAVAADQISADAYYNLASTYHRLGDDVEAERTYWHCLALDPNHSKAHHAYVVLLLELERSQEAYELVERWQAQYPGSPDPLVEMAWLEHQADRPEQAKQLLHQVIAINPRHSRALTELASIYEANKESDRALALYQRALAAHPNHPDLSNKVADLRGTGATPGVNSTMPRNPYSPPEPSRTGRDLRYQLR